MAYSLSSAEVENLGAIFIGFVTTTVLYGLTFFQTYIYHTRYPRDPQWLKYLVAALWTLDTAASALICEVLYYYLIILFDVNLEVLYASTSFCIQYMLSVILTFISNLFFALRVFQVTGGSRLVTAVLIFLSFLALVSGLTTSVQMIVERRLSALGLLHMEITAAASLVAGVMVDIVLFLTMSYSLRRRRYAEVVTPHSFLSIIAKVLVSHGFVLILAQGAYFFVFVAAPSRQIWIPFQMVASKIYVGILLGQLNSRRIWQGQGLNEEESLPTRKAPVNGRFSSAIRLSVNDFKGTSPSVHFVTNRPKDAESIVIGLESKGMYDEHGNEYTQVSSGSSQSQTDEAVKTCLSVD